MLMEDQRALDADRIRFFSGHWSATVRQRIALALGRVRDSAHVTPLLELTADPEPAVQVDAVFALGLLADSSGPVVSRLAGLMRQHGADSIGTEAAAALAKSASAAAFDSLIALVRSTSPAPVPATSQALVSLWRFGDRAGQMTDVITPFSRDPDPEVRWRALYPLVRNGLASGSRLYLERMADTVAEVRALAARGLRAPATESAGLRDAAVGALRTALGDAHPHVRINTLGSLATYRDRAVLSDVRRSLSDPDGNVRMAALQAITAIAGPEAAGDLERLVAAADEKIGIRVAALTALARLVPARAAPLLDRWAVADGWYERLVAARTLATLPWQVGRVNLIELAGDADVRVARAAIGSIGRVADAQDARAVLLDGAREPDPQIRAAAISALSRGATPADLSMFMDAFDQARYDPVPDAAVAAANALGSLARAGAPVANAFFARFEPHPDPAVRRAVDRGIGPEWGPAEPSGTTKGLRFYEEVVRSLVAPVLAGAQPPMLRILTAEGPIDIELAPTVAPLTVHNMISLVGSGYYDAGDDPDARRWHRVVPNFVLQDGEPVGDGSGSPGFAIRDEINRIRYARGVLGMALSGPDTGGGQFFITHSPQPHLDGGYTIFGRVVNGMDAADAVVQDDRILGMEIVRP
jgi:cyclophilin family peptidyl-prolyl cis-trans isomerase/HEAT repeat protein